MVTKCVGCRIDSGFAFQRQTVVSEPDRSPECYAGRVSQQNFNSNSGRILPGVLDEPADCRAADVLSPPIVANEELAKVNPFGLSLIKGVPDDIVVIYEQH